MLAGAIHLAKQLVPNRAEIVLKCVAARKHCSSPYAEDAMQFSNERLTTGASSRPEVLAPCARIGTGRHWQRLSQGWRGDGRLPAGQTGSDVRCHQVARVISGSRQDFERGPLYPCLMADNQRTAYQRPLRCQDRTHAPQQSVRATPRSFPRTLNDRWRLWGFAPKPPKVKESKLQGTTSVLPTRKPRV